MTRAAFLAAAALALANPALAAETGGCGRFAWSIAAERELLAAAPEGPPRPDAAPPAAFRLALRPVAEAGLPVPPERPARGEPGRGGFATLVVPEAGTYRVTMSAEGWLDAVQGSAYRKAEAFSGIRDCPGVRKSVKFRLEPGPVVLQVSGSSADAVVMALTRDRD